MEYSGVTVSRAAPLQGDLQVQVMQVAWRLQAAAVDQVRDALPPQHQSSYNTVQTVLNRLAERGLLERERDGRRFLYRPSISEAEYVSQSIHQALAGASADARQAALANLIGAMEPGELSHLRRRAKAIDRRRQSR